MAAELPAPVPFLIAVPSDVEALWTEPDGAGDLARLDVYGEAGLTERLYAATIVLDLSVAHPSERLYGAIGESVFVRSLYALDPDISWIGGDALKLEMASVGAVGAYDDGNGNIVAVRIVGFARDGAERGVMVAGAISTAAAGIRRESIVEDLTGTVTWRMIDSIQPREN